MMIQITKNFKYSQHYSLSLSQLKLTEKNNYSSNFSKIIKIQINRGLGKFVDNKTIIKSSINEFRLITGQQPKLIYAKKSIAGFKLREKMVIGLTLTLRAEHMYSFFERLLDIALPQIPNFKGFSLQNFDTFGNYNFGISDQSIFPEIPYTLITKQLGFNITIVFLKKNKNINLSLLKKFNFPFS